MTFSFYATQFLNGLAYGMLLFLLAGGLSLIFGLMDIINLAHGALYILGAYFGLTLVTSTGHFWLAAVIAPVAVGVCAILLEGLVRPLYRRSYLDQVLLTFGISLIVADGIKLIWGPDIRSLQVPELLAGTVPVFGSPFPVYRLFLIGVGLLLFAALTLLIERSRLGAIVRAGVSDRQMVTGLGINITAIFSIVFGIGGVLAGLSGVLAAPILGIFPGLDFEVLLLALIIVVIGGMGTMQGAFWGSLIVAEVETFGKVLLPDLELFLLFILMAAVLVLKPSGLLGKKAAF